MSHLALLIIDMQKGMSTQAAGSRNNPGAESAIAALLSHWRKVGAPVVHVRHISRTPGSLFWPGQPGVEFQAQLAPLESEHIVEKMCLTRSSTLVLNVGYMLAALDVSLS